MSEIYTRKAIRLVFAMGAAALAVKMWDVGWKCNATAMGVFALSWIIDYAQLRTE